MSERRAPKPSPLAGEGAERPRDPSSSIVRGGSQKRGREAGEGALRAGTQMKERRETPHPAPRRCSAPPSPARGEGYGALWLRGVQQ